MPAAVADVKGITKKFHLGDLELYVTANPNPDGSLKEIFVHGAGQEGSFIRAMFDAFAIPFSTSLQAGVEFGYLARKFHAMKFDPQGLTGDPEIPEVNSILDYITRWLVMRFGDEQLKKEILS